MYPCIHHSIYPSIHLSINPSVHKSIHLYAICSLSIHRSVYSFFQLPFSFICIHMHTYIHIYIYITLYIYKYVYMYIIMYVHLLLYVLYTYIWSVLDSLPPVHPLEFKMAQWVAEVVAIWTAAGSAGSAVWIFYTSAMRISSHPLPNNKKPHRRPWTTQVLCVNIYI